MIRNKKGKKVTIILLLLIPAYLLFVLFFPEFEIWDWLENKVKRCSSKSMKTG